MDTVDNAQAGAVESGINLELEKVHSTQLDVTATPPPTSAVDEVKQELQVMVDQHEMNENEASSLQKVFQENEALKDKVSKLKALLGRSGE